MFFGFYLYRWSEEALNGYVAGGMYRRPFLPPLSMRSTCQLGIGKECVGNIVECVDGFAELVSLPLQFTKLAARFEPGSRSYKG